jgi:DNA-binding NarL/FixJ family response regulator
VTGLERLSYALVALEAHDLARPALVAERDAAVRELASEGQSLRAIARALRLSHTAVANIVRVAS